MELVKKLQYGYKNNVIIEIYGKNIDTDNSEYTWVIIFNDKKVEWNLCEDNCSGAVFINADEASEAAIDYIVDHYMELKNSIPKHNVIAQNRKESEENELDYEQEVYLDELENNIEEIPEDFRLNKKEGK